MKIQVQGLKGKVQQEFPKKYHRFAAFVNSGPIWDEFCEVLQDKDLLSHIIFCNDVMLIPPVRTHLMISGYRSGPAAGRKLEDEEKKALGAVYGFLFKEIFHYSQQESVSCVINTLKTATRYGRDEKETMELVEGAKAE
ncbi:MAG: hypothetical protein HFF51_09950 [Lawsonibacter sp.]|jgi:hypothetical protein|nr:hypothetical protein [Lawsonibacter sp.]